ncbi:MAG: PAS domain-containing sensor histidine kinase [Rhodocyclaceae bacterium]
MSTTRIGAGAAGILDLDDGGWLSELPDAAMLLDPEGRVLRWSAGAGRMFGYAADEALGVAIDRLIVLPERHDEQQGFVAEALQRGQATFETLRRRKDGTLIYVDISARLVRGHGTAGGATLLFAEKDVTALKVERDSKALEARYRELLESTPDGIVIVNPTGHILIANTQAERLFGYGASELRARPVELLLPERFRGSHKGHRSHYFSQPRTRAMGAGLELYGLRKDGTEFPVEISLAPLSTAETPLVMSAIRDVSERKRFEKALQEKNLELEQANRAKDRFLASMSHELRTPLNAVIGFTGTLLMRLPGELNDEQARQLEIVRSNARHLLALINDLLNLAKIEAGKVELNPEPTDCTALLQELAESLRPQAQVKGLELRVSLPAEPATLALDRRAFSQIVINLTSNAIKFTSEGHVRLVLETSTSDDGRTGMTVTVEDTGPGIHADELGMLFEPFVRGATARLSGVEGSGLGLHLSRKLAELLGGDLSCRSAVGVGSAFVLRVWGGVE